MYLNLDLKKKTHGTHTPVEVLNSFYYLWRVLEIQTQFNVNAKPSHTYNKLAFFILEGR